MRGEILEFDAATGGGVLVDDYGARYTFDGAAVRAPLSLGDRVDFSAENGVATAISPAAPQPEAPVWETTPEPPRSPGYDFAHAMFSFNGRLGRTHYWISWGILFGAGVVVSLIPVIGFVGILALLWPNIAKDVKRLHDMGHTGWWALVPQALGFLAGAALVVLIIMIFAGHPAVTGSPLVAALAQSSAPVWFGIAGVWLVQAAFWLWFGIGPSQPGANRFGPDPTTPIGTPVGAS